MMKHSIKNLPFLLFLIATGFTPKTQAFSSQRAKKYMICLGQEELAIHKQKLGGAYTRLNKDIISSLLQLRKSVVIDKKREAVICKAKFPSLKTLELIMTDRLFYSGHRKDLDRNNYQIDLVTLEELKKTSAKTFIHFIAGLQASLSTADCLKKEIPELRLFFERMQFILQDVGLRKVLKTLKNPKKIFKKLQKILESPPKCTSNKNA